MPALITAGLLSCAPSLSLMVAAGIRDRIAQAMPDLWQDAGKGALLVDDSGDWRVWRLPACGRNGGE